MALPDKYFSIMDDKYFTSVDTSKYVNPSTYQDVTIGESFSPQGPMITQVNNSISHGVPAVMLHLMEPASGKGAQGLGSSIGRVSDVQRDAMAELILVNKMDFNTHAPIVDIMGLSGGQGSPVRLDEQKRADNEEVLRKSITFADEISKTAGLENVPVTIHTTNGLGSIHKFKSRHKKNDGSLVEGWSNSMVNVETGEIMPAKSSFKWMPKGSKGFDPVPGTERPDGMQLFEITPEKHVEMANRQSLDRMRGEIAEAVEKQHRYQQMLATNPNIPPDERARIAKSIEDLQITINTRKTDIQNVDYQFKTGKGYNQFMLIKDYSMEKIPEILSDMALFSLEKTETKPVIAPENLPSHMLGANPDLLVNWVEKSRDVFAEKLVNEKGYDRDSARAKARQLIGMTLDTGHINTLKQFGHSDKDIEAWTKKMAPDVKLVHLADNIGEFGHDIHMLVGRGNAPVNEIMNILKENGFKGQASFEAFQTEGEASGTLANVRGINAPLYSSHAHPSVPQISFDMVSPYSFSNRMYSHQLPDLHFKEWGGPFAGMPSTFGAGSPNKDQFSGTPTA